MHQSQGRAESDLTAADWLPSSWRAVAVTTRICDIDPPSEGQTFQFPVLTEGLGRTSQEAV